MDIDIISTGSHGNAVLLNGAVLVDCGVPFCKLSEALPGLKLVLLSHVHGDHLNPATVRRINQERPTVRFACCSWLADPLLKAGIPARQIDIFVPESPMVYPGIGVFEAVELYHDVPNCGWKMQLVQPGTPPQSETVFYATDTGSLQGIECPGYDYFLVEGNYKTEELEARLALKQAAGACSYERRAAAYHLSEEKALEWISRNAGPNSKYILMHKHIDK